MSIGVGGQQFGTDCGECAIFGDSFQPGRGFGTDIEQIKRTVVKSEPYRGKKCPAIWRLIGYYNSDFRH